MMRTFSFVQIKLKQNSKSVVNLILEVYKDFDLEDYSFRLSYRDPADTKRNTLMMMRCGKKHKVC